MRVLVVNAGSSSLKLRLLSAGDEVEGRTDLGAPADLPADELAGALTALLRSGPPDAVGHRVVHGGTRFSSGVVVDAGVREALADLVALAPLHQPASLAGIDAVTAVLPDVPAVACFDTAFHAGMPAAASTYAVPARWRERWGVRRYGFHGLSHAYAARRAAELRPGGAFRVVTAHLGAGASLAAVRDGRSLDTTMGFTPLEGVVMATRSGTVDPGLVTWLQQRHGLSAGEVSDALEHRSGLLGLAGTADMAEVVARAAVDEPDARLAVDVYVHRARAAVAAMATALGGLDALAFTGGVGENASVVRAMIVAELEWLGLAVNPGRNAAARADADVSAAGSPGSVLVVTAREDLEIAREVRRVLGPVRDHNSVTTARSTSEPP